MKYLLGIDEAGRGPLAGPVAVGVVLVKKDFDWGMILGVGDSKKITPKNREAVFGQAEILKKNGSLDFHVTMTSAKDIDTIGIVPSINKAMLNCLNNLKKRNSFGEKEVVIKLDGALRAPSNFPNQETIIKGDAKELCIGLASIMAKVTRDRYMEKISVKYPEYDFAKHKGYGTKTHRESIKKYGFCNIHRRSFCTKLT